jgi:ferredoxin
MISFLITALFVALGIVLSTMALFFVSAMHGIRNRQDPEAGKGPKRLQGEPLAAAGTVHENAQKAVIRCGRIPPVISERFATTGYTDCWTRNSLFGGNLGCHSGCLGLGSCAASCPSDAIVFRDGFAYVNDACNGCGVCVDACPKRLITMVPVTLKECFDCAARGTPDERAECPIAREGCKIDLRNFPESGFKLLSRWGILKAKSR